jgi:hypothetical protein
MKGAPGSRSVGDQKCVVQAILLGLTVVYAGETGDNAIGMFLIACFFAAKQGKEFNRVRRKGRLGELSGDDLS